MGAESHMWLCESHAKDTELHRVRQLQQACADAVSMLVQWYWQDGHQLCAYNPKNNALLERAVQRKQRLVRLPSSSCGPQTVLLHATPMIVEESGARVVRVSRET